MAVVTSVLMSHFRSHLRAELALDGRPVALVGANGAGKTNVLEAVSLLSPGRGIRRAAAEAMVRQPEGVGWKIRANVDGTEVETWAEPDRARQVKLNGKTATQAALADVARVLWLVPVMDRLWVEGADGRRRFLDRAVMSFDPGHAEATLAYEKAMRERNRLLKDQVRDAHWYAAIERQMAEAGETIRRGRAETVARLVKAQQGAETAFPAADLTLTDAEPWDDLGAALAASRGRDIQAGRTLVGPHRSDLVAVWRAKGVAAKDCSTGEQKALLVSLILANARALAADGVRPLILLDEVAAHLDAGRRAALYDEICALGLQAWMTGTEAHLFDTLGDRAQVFEVSEEAGASVMR